MGVPPDLQLSSRDVASLIVIGVYIILIGIMWNAPVLRNILYPFKVLLNLETAPLFYIVYMPLLAVHLQVDDQCMGAGADGGIS